MLSVREYVIREQIRLQRMADEENQLLISQVNQQSRSAALMLNFLLRARPPRPRVRIKRKVPIQ